MSAAPKTKGFDKEKCRILTPEFRVSYPHVFKAQAVKPTDKPKFSITMLFPKDGDVSVVKEAIKNAKLAKYGSKENFPEELQSPVINGDLPKYADKEGYKGHWVIKASTNEDQRPGVVDASVQPILDPSQFYPGCYARAYVYATCWEYMGREGVMFILDHVQKTRDGKSFGGKKPAEQVFQPISAGLATDLDSDEDGDVEADEDF